MKKAYKIANFRLPLVLALSLAAGVAVAYAFAVYRAEFIWMIAAVPLTAVIFIVCALVTRSWKPMLFCALACALFITGVFYAGGVLYSYESSSVRTGELCYISGVVKSRGETSSGGTYLILSDAVTEYGGLDGDIIIYIDEQTEGYARTGYKVRVSGVVEKYDLFCYGELNYRAADGIKYYANACGDLNSEYAFSLFGGIREGIYAVLYENCDYETAAVAYAMLTGDTGDMSLQTLSSFRYGGVAHIFAVSGLHIGVLFGVLSALASFLRINKKISFAAIIILIFLYAGVCGFTPSSVRAAVMCTVAAAAKLLYAKYDSLNALSVAVIILLLLNPLNLFDVGFVLSVSAMLGIIFLSPNIRRLLLRTKLPRGLCGGIAVSAGAQAATFPALLLTFGYVSGAGIILNVLVLPLLSALYVVTFAAVVICAVVAPLASFMSSALLPLSAVINFFVTFGFENSLISGFGGWWVALFVFAAIFALSDKFNLCRSARAIACSLCAVCFVTCTVLGGAVFGSETRIVVGAYYDGGMVLVRNAEGNVLIVTDGMYTGRLTSFINRYCPLGADKVIILGGESAADYVYELDYDFADIYLPPDGINLPAPDGSTAHYESSFELCGTHYSFVDGYTLRASAGGVDFAVCAGRYIDIQSTDLLITLHENTSCNAATQVCFDGKDGDYDVYSQGCLQFIADNGKLVLTGLVPAP